MARSSIAPRLYDQTMVCRCNGEPSLILVGFALRKHGDCTLIEPPMMVISGIKHRVFRHKIHLQQPFHRIPLENSPERGVGALDRQAAAGCSCSPVKHEAQAEESLVDEVDAAEIEHDIGVLP